MPYHNVITVITTSDMLINMMTCLKEKKMRDHFCIESEDKKGKKEDNMPGEAYSLTYVVSKTITEIR